MSADDKLEPVAWGAWNGSFYEVGIDEENMRFRHEPKRKVVPLYDASALEASEAKIAALTAENATLREALEAIRTHISVSGTSSLDMREIARAALRQEGKP